MSQKFLDLQGVKTLLNSIKERFVSKKIKIANQTLDQDITAEALAAELDGLVGGMDGKSAYQIAQDNGFEGTEVEWLNSLKGEGLNVLGSYTSEEELLTNHPVGSMGDSYIVNTDLYIWDELNLKWVNVGPFQGPKGETGEQGLQGNVGEQGPQGETGSSGVYIGPETPTDDNITVWFNPNGLPDYGLTENDKKEIAGYIKSTLSQVEPPTFVLNISEMTDINKQYVLNNHIYAYINNNWTNTNITYTPVLYTDIIGIVDENNTIRLTTNNLPSGTYTLKYGIEDYEIIGTITV